jgi:hypothetical protein
MATEQYFHYQIRRDRQCEYVWNARITISHYQSFF